MPGHQSKLRQRQERSKRARTEETGNASIRIPPAERAGVDGRGAGTGGVNEERAFGNDELERGGEGSYDVSELVLVE